MDHVFKVNEKFMVGSLKFTGTFEWVLAGDPTSIIQKRLEDMRQWALYEKGYIIESSIPKEGDLCPRMICEMLVISKDYDFLPVTFFSHSEMGDIMEEIKNMINTKEFTDVFERKCWGY